MNHRTLITLDHLIRDAETLLKGDYSAKELSTIIRNYGHECELLLKISVFTDATAKDELATLIGRLKLLGVPKDIRMTLNRMRILYNEAKHDPKQIFVPTDVMMTLKGSKDAIAGLQKLGLLKELSDKKIQYRPLWFAVWDHYAGGDSEFQIFIPNDEPDKRARRIDIIYLKISEWDSALQEIRSRGEVKIGADSVSSTFYNECNSESDLLQVGSFSGSYRDLIEGLSKYEARLDLIPFLKRENDFSAAFSALVFAAVDVFEFQEPLDSVEGWIKRVLLRADSQYALPSTDQVKTLAEKIVKPFYNAKVEHSIKVISNLRWVTSARFDRVLDSVVRDDDMGILVTRDEEVFVSID